MSVLAFLIPIALILGALWLVAFVWSLHNGQYDDLEGAKLRILEDHPPAFSQKPTKHAQENTP